jgi:hypothetical protein
MRTHVLMALSQSSRVNSCTFYHVGNMWKLKVCDQMLRHFQLLLSVGKRTVLNSTVGY